MEESRYLEHGPKKSEFLPSEISQWFRKCYIADFFHNASLLLQAIVHFVTILFNRKVVTLLHITACTAAA